MGFQLVVVIIGILSDITVAIHSFGNVARKIISIIFLAAVSFADFSNAAPTVQY